MNSNQVRNIVIGILSVTLAATGVTWWLSSGDEQQPVAKKSPTPIQTPAEPVAPKTSPVPVQAEVEVEEPVVVVEPKPAPEPEVVVEPQQPKLFDFKLPPLDESDPTLIAQLKQKVAKASLRLLVDEGMIERFVVTADSISRGDIPYNLLPVERPAGRYKVIEAQEHFYSSTANIARYQPYLDLIASMPLEHWLAFYDHLYPLLQESYERLGYPDQSFHTVLLQALDVLQGTPKPSASIKLVQPNVMYEYADEGLQQDGSAVEKLMLRLGPETNSKLKALLKGLEQGLKQRQF